MVVHLKKGAFGEVFGWDTCDKDGGGLDGIGMGGCDKGVLTGCDKVGHFALDVVPYPNYGRLTFEMKGWIELTGKQPSQNNMSGVPRPLFTFDITKDE